MPLIIDGKVSSFSEEVGTVFDFTLHVHWHKEFVRSVRIRNGALYRVEPLNPLKKKHRGRVGELVQYGDKGNVCNMRFCDNNRIGSVCPDDLVEVGAEHPQSEDKKTKNRTTRRRREMTSKL